MRALWVTMVLAAVTLAGCADGSDVRSGDDDEFDDIDTKATATTGVIRGVVFDAAIVPVEGAKIAIKSAEKETTSSEDGTFFFENLQPGAYFLDVAKAGYERVQASTTVEAGIDKPPVVKVQLIADLSSRPIAELLTFEGYLQCGAGIGGVASTNPCFVADSLNTFETPVQRPVDFAQLEMTWEGTNVFGDGLSLGIHDPYSGTGLSDFAGTDGPSPRILPVPGETITGALGEDYEDYLIRVFPGTSQPVSVVVEQRFSIFATNFYGMEPDEGWAFITDGPHPIPE